MLSNRENNIITVAVSGGFDPIHVGHVQLLKEARKLGDRLIVILNNDNWLVKKKGLTFIPENERKEILEAIRYVDEVILTNHPENPSDMSVCKELELLKPGNDLSNIKSLSLFKLASNSLLFIIGFIF